MTRWCRLTESLRDRRRLMWGKLRTHTYGEVGMEFTAGLSKSRGNTGSVCTKSWVTIPAPQKWMQWHTAISPAPRSWRQEDGEFKVIFGCVVNLRPVWVIWDPALGGKKSRETSGVIYSNVPHIRIEGRAWCICTLSLGPLWWIRRQL